jgi:hypothetical protein
MELTQKIVDASIFFFAYVLVTVAFFSFGNPPDYLKFPFSFNNAKRLLSTESIPDVSFYLFLPLSLAGLIFAAWKIVH